MTMVRCTAPNLEFTVGIGGTADMNGRAASATRSRLTQSRHRCIAATYPAPSFDHLVGERKQLRRNFEPERLGGLEVYRQFSFDRRPSGCGASNKGDEIGPSH